MTDGLGSVKKMSRKDIKHAVAVDDNSQPRCSSVKMTAGLTSVKYMSSKGSKRAKVLKWEKVARDNVCSKTVSSNMKPHANYQDTGQVICLVRKDAPTVGDNKINHEPVRE